MDQTHKEKLEYIIEKFNADLTNNGKGLSIPTMLRLKTLARDLLSRAYSELMKHTDQSKYTCGTGGFENE